MVSQDSHTRQEVDQEQYEESTGRRKALGLPVGRGGFSEEVTFQLSFEKKGGKCSSQEGEVKSLPGKGKNTQLAQGWGKEGLCCVDI